MPVVQIADSEGNTAEIELKINKDRSRHAKWRCRTLGALNDTLLGDDWHDATVTWSIDLRDNIVTEVICYADYWDDGQALPILELENVWNQGILYICDLGEGRVRYSRAGYMAEGDMTWRNARY